MLIGQISETLCKLILTLWWPGKFWSILDLFKAWNSVLISNENGSEQCYCCMSNIWLVINDFRFVPGCGRRVLPAAARRETRSIPGVDWFPVEGPRRAESGRRDALRTLTQGTAPLVLLLKKNYKNCTRNVHSCLQRNKKAFSRMHTARLLTVSRSIACIPREAGGLPLRHTPLDVDPLVMWPVVHTGKPSHPMDRMTYACENIT